MHTKYKGLEKKTQMNDICWMYVHKLFCFGKVIGVWHGVAITTSWLNTYEHLEGIRCILMKYWWNQHIGNTYVDTLTFPKKCIVLYLFVEN